ncbi:MAG: PAS domain S-box protein [Bacillota bacterium]|nr:PAS domain S-box protein [Bacillota bacterium]
MDYINMTKEELIQENQRLRSDLAHLQDSEITALNNMQVFPLIQPSNSTTVPDLFCRFSPDFKFTLVNEAFTQSYKREREDFIGQTIVSMLDEEYQEKIINILLSLSPNNPVASVEYTWTDVNSQTRWLRWKARAIFDKNYSLIEYHAVGREVTEQKKAEEQIQHRLRIEQTIAQASKLLMGSEEADMNEILKIIGETMAVNRVYIFELRDNNLKFDNTFEWCDAHTTSVIADLQDLDTEVFAWGLRQLLNGDRTFISDISSLPPEALCEKESMEMQGIYAALFVPINGIDANLLGYIGFDDTEKCRIWKEEDTQCLKLLAELLGVYWERQRMEKELRASAVKFQTLAETAPAIIFVLKPPFEDAKLLYINNGYSLASGYSKEDAFNKNYWDFVHPDYRVMLYERAWDRLHGKIVPSNYDVKLLNRMQENLWGDFSMATIDWDGTPAIIGVIYDITERKVMEEKLRQSRDELESRVKERTAELELLNEKLQQEVAKCQQAEAELILSETRYRAIVQDQSEMIIRFLPDYTITFVNTAYCLYSGKNIEDLIGENAILNIYEEDQAEIMTKFDSLNLDYLEFVHTFRSMRTDGNISWQEWTARAIINGQEIIEIQAVGRDVSARKIAEQALKRSEANFRALAETSPVLIYVYSEGRFLYFNSMLETITCVPGEELFQMDPMQLFHPDCREMVTKNAIARQKGENIPPYEVSMINKSGQQIWGYLYADIIDYERQKAVMGIVVDITERKKMEEDLLQTSKLDSLGILAGGIAHDFNNILTVISGNISLSKMIVDDHDELLEILTEVEKAAFQARDLTQQLLTFSKGGAPIKETSTIQELLRDSASFVLRGSNVSCNYSIDDDLWPVSIDKGQISQVIYNFIINADQAMPDGGSMQLLAENINAGPDIPLSLTAGHYIKISIKDEGIGIAEKYLGKIFDPYFTTKQKGHGLGLATCYSIIKKHDGDIKVHSGLDIGTTMDVYLPAFPDQLVEVNNLSSVVLSGQGKILIMDDESAVRETLGKMLRHLGYTTGLAIDGLNAIHLYIIAQQANEPYDAVIMDLTVAGGMGGKEAIKKLLEIDAGAKVIVSSGYFNDPVMADYKKYGFCGVLPKPYEINAVNKLLYELINRKEAV